MTSSINYLLLGAALLLTIVIEGITVFIFRKDKKYVGYSVLVNLITNPAVNLIIFRVNNDLWLWRRWFFSGDVTAPYVFVLEAAVVVIEAVCYRAMTGESMGESMKLSFVLNITSYTIGLFLNTWFSYIFW